MSDRISLKDAQNIGLLKVLGDSVYRQAWRRAIGRLHGHSGAMPVSDAYALAIKSYSQDNYLYEGHVTPRFQVPLSVEVLVEASERAISTTPHSIKIKDAFKNILNRYEALNHPQKEKEMKTESPSQHVMASRTTMPLSSATLVFGKDAEKCSNDELMEAIRKISATIASYKDLEDSIFVKKEVASLVTQRKAVIEILDSRS